MEGEGSHKAFSEEISEWTEINLANCIGVDACMKVCPVVDPSLTIRDLNFATASNGKLGAETVKFAIDCIQCGRCDTVCPTAAGRSVMMLSLKEKVAKAGKSPDYHRKYFQLKGHDKSALRQSAFNSMIKTKWRFSAIDKVKSEKLSEHIDKEEFKKAEYLIYLGCYIFTKEESAVQTIEIADKAGIDYEVLGGLKSCCGWPSLLAGRTGESEDYHQHLAKLIEKSGPKYVVSGCAECYSSLRKVKDKYQMSFEPLTTPMWIEHFVDKLDLKKTNGKVTFHDSCHVSRKAGRPEPARKLLSRMAPIEEMKRSGAKDGWCCGYWGLGSDKAVTKKVHLDRYDEAKGTGAATMIVECVSCLESFSKTGDEAGVVIRDIVDLVHERMKQ